MPCRVESTAAKSRSAQVKGVDFLVECRVGSTAAAKSRSAQVQGVNFLVECRVETTAAKSRSALVRSVHFLSSAGWKALQQQNQQKVGTGEEC